MKNLRALAAVLAVCTLASGCMKDAPVDSSSKVVSGVVSSSPQEFSSLAEQDAPEPSNADISEAAPQNQQASNASDDVSSEQNALLNKAKQMEENAKKSDKSAELTLSANEIELGEILVLTLDNVKGNTVSASSSLGFMPRFFEDGEKLKALVPISYNLTPGKYTITVTADGKTFNETINAVDREFEVQNLTIDDSVSSTTNTAEANIEWERKIEPLKLVSDPERCWEGTFLQPVNGQITTEYGMKRYTNGSKTPSRHSGIDIAAKQGTPVLAAESGRVQFAGFLILTGNTIVIEHGLGLKSFYYHMQSTNVNTGDVVEQGDVIGAVGSTGYSTGPHLHFAATVNNVFVNPWTLFSKEIG